VNCGKEREERMKAAGEAEIVNKLPELR